MADLDPRQDAAVAAGPVDVFVSAGAGSGKTRVLTARFVAAVLGEGPYLSCTPGELLTVTFTDKAASELTERIRRALSAAGDHEAARAVGDAWISTIHGMCARMLRQHAFDAGVDPHFRVLDQVEASSLEAEALEASVTEALNTDPGVVALFDSYGFEPVVTAARATLSSIHALGLRAEHIHTLAADEAAASLPIIAAELRELASAFGDLRTVKTVGTNAGVVRCAADSLEAALSGSATASVVLAEVTGAGMRRLKSVEGLDELVEEAKGLIGQARLAAAQMLVGPFEAALIAFIQRFEDRYAHLKMERGALDFEDLQVMTAHLLEARPDVAEEYRSRFAMLMVDEFQDTNALQLRITEQLSRNNLCTVGDENQSIYAFRHADVEVFRDRAQRVGVRRQLDINYRMAPPLLEVVNKLFTHPALLGPTYMSLHGPALPEDRPVWPVGEYRFEARYLDWSDVSGADTHLAEAECIADRVQELVAAGVAPGDIAVLMRALAGGRAAKVEQALTARGVPVYLASGGAFFDSTEIVEARALLKAIDNVWDDAALTVTLAGRLTGLSTEGLMEVRRCADLIAAERGARSFDAHLWDALTSERLELAPDDAEAARRTVEAIVSARRLRGLRPLSDTVREPLLALDADLVLLASGSGGSRAWSNLLKLARLAGEYESGVGGDLRGFLEYLDLRELHSTSEQEATLEGELEAVRIMSIHAAKGLEFPAVILGGLGGSRDIPAISVARVDGQPLLGMKLAGGDGTMPTIASEAVRKTGVEASAAEAIRLLYVGCTRARESLTIIARTDPSKDADGALGGLVRCALGFGEAELLVTGDSVIVPDVAKVSLVPPTSPGGSSVPGTPEGEARGEAEVGPSNWNAGEPPMPASLPAPVPALRQHPPAPRRISYTGLATYGRCPYRFYLTSIARLPAPPAAQGGEALAFGSAVHAVLERLGMVGGDASAHIAAAARSANLGKATTERLRHVVSAYVASPIAAEVRGSERAMHEAPIAVPVAGTILAGALDVIAWHNDSALIVDYKTGTGSLTEGDAEERYRLQAECYALAALSAGASTVRVVFSELERTREIAFAFGPGERDRIAGDITAIIDRMRSDGYPPRESYDENLCETCPGLGGMCPVTRPSAVGAG